MGTSWAARSRARRRRVAPWEPSVLPRELRRKLGKVGKSLQSAPCSSRYFSRGLIVGSAARRSVAFLVWWPLLALSHPLFHGAVARRARCSIAIPCLLGKFPRSPAASAPPRLGAPLRRAPLRCPSPLPTPQPQTSRPESSRPHPVLHHWALPLLFLAVPQPPSSRPTLVLLLCVPRSPKLPSLGPRSLEVCSALPSGTGGSGGGGHD